MGILFFFLDFLYKNKIATYIFANVGIRPADLSHNHCPIYCRVWKMKSFTILAFGLVVLVAVSMANPQVDEEDDDVHDELALQEGEGNLVSQQAKYSDCI